MPRPRSGTPPRLAGPFVASFRACVDSLAPTRGAFERWLETRCDEGARDELAVVYSELTANAVAGAPDDSLAVDVVAWWEGADVVLQVANPVDGAETPQSWDLDDALRSGGRGLVIVDAFVDELFVQRDARGRHVVRCRRNDAA